MIYANEEREREIENEMGGCARAAVLRLSGRESGGGEGGGGFKGGGDGGGGGGYGSCGGGGFAIDWKRK